MNGLSSNHFPAFCCQKWLKKIDTYLLDTKKRPIPVTAYVRDDLNNLLLVTAKSNNLTRSELIHYCVETEIQKQILRWGCIHPNQFISLMTSTQPLNYLNNLNNCVVA